MTTLHDLQRRKSELLERYCAARLEESLEELRGEAVQQADAEKFPWKGEFRTREEIEFWYSERKRWDRRFLVDMALVVVLLTALCYSASLGVKIMLPLPPEGPHSAASR
jgi:hypothetical protein